MADRLWKERKEPRWRFNRTAALCGLLVHIVLISFTYSQLPRQVLYLQGHTNIARVWLVIDFPSSILPWLLRNKMTGRLPMMSVSKCFLMLCLAFGSLQWFLLCGWIYRKKAHQVDHAAPAKKIDPFAD